jgi:leucine dehydrogenase
LILKEIFELHHFSCSKLGVEAFIAIDKQASKEKPGLGGVRIKKFISTQQAQKEVLDLAMTMHHKSQVHDLPVCGAKAVICLSKNTLKPIEKQAVLKQFSSWVNSLNGRYVTAVDIGSSEEDMNFLSQYTPYVTGSIKQGGDPSEKTAQGVFLSIKSVSNQILNKPLNQITVSLQGIGKTGEKLLQKLVLVGVKVIVTDIDQVKLKLIQNKYGVKTVRPENIYAVQADIFSPCAVGNLLSPCIIDQLKANYVVGAANCILADQSYINYLAQKNIGYVPDYLSNGGGLIQCVQQYFGLNIEYIEYKLSEIYQKTMQYRLRQSIPKSA